MENVISADDPQALEKLQARLEKLEAKQKEMRAVNAYYRKHKTLDGCPGLPPTGIERLKAKMSPVPFFPGRTISQRPLPLWPGAGSRWASPRYQARCP